MKSEVKDTKPVKDGLLVQVPFRCSEEFRSRIHRALGREMTRSGEKISVNEFIRKLLDSGLKQFGE